MEQTHTPQVLERPVSWTLRLAWAHLVAWPAVGLLLMPFRRHNLSGDFTDGEIAWLYWMVRISPTILVATLCSAALEVRHREKRKALPLALAVTSPLLLMVLLLFARGYGW